jgi:hypothetical protein
MSLSEAISEDPWLGRMSGGVRASFRDATSWIPEPGDKSPGYCHMSLRHTFKPKLRPRT